MTTLLKLTRTAMAAGALAAGIGTPAAAPLALAKSFEGNLNFTGTQASLQDKTGGAKACVLAADASASISLPADATIVSATLYWAGSGPLDAEVTLDGAAVVAPAERRFTSSRDGLQFFAAAAEVTAQVQGKTSFSFGGLNAATGAPYCSNKPKDNAVLGGFALVVVYSHASEKYRTVNLYEGFQVLKDSAVTVAMPDYTPRAGSKDSGRFGYIVWEGDKTGQQKGDTVSFAGETLQRAPFIQNDNAFNSRSSINGDENSGGIDFDHVELATGPDAASKAKATFTTKSDRVLLGTAIVALPAQPADLSITKTQSGQFKLDNEITYTLKVSNLGTRSDSQVTVKDELPSALQYVSASGADWNCTVEGQTVTCKYGKALAAGSSASVDIKARIKAEGTIRNTAEVSGTADGVSGNNTSTVEGGGNPVPRDPYVFTVGKCSAGETIRASGEGGCVVFTGPLVAGESRDIYVTRATEGVATPVNATAASTPTLRFALQCNNPSSDAGVAARYANVDLPLCLGDGTALSATNGKASTLSFGANEPSAQASFSYRDLGFVTLMVRDAAGNSGKVRFASRPESIQAGYTRDIDGVANPAADTLEGAGFAEAGEPFRVTVSAFGAGGVGPLPNFGRESGDQALASKLEVEVDGAEAAAKPLQLLKDWNGAGAVYRTYAWNEAGAVRLAPALNGYLGMNGSLGPGFATVGRFYPVYLKTETEGGFACLKRMACPATAPEPVTRAAFSAQPFTARVRAFGRNNELLNFDGALVPEIKLGAVSAPGGDRFLDGLSDPADKRLKERDVSFKLAVGFDAAKPRTGGWTAPTAVHLRASIEEYRQAASGTERILVTSEPRKLEGGIMVVNGRLMVVNAIGSGLARTPVPLRAQFWSGLAWEQNSGVDDEEAVTGTIKFSACRRGLRADTTAPDGENCDTSLLRLAGSGTGTTTNIPLPKLDGGKSTLWLAPVDKSGTVDILVEGYDYLPSTYGRVSFGQFKSPVIYVREMY